MGDGAAIMTRFFGSFIVGSVVMAIYIGFIRAEGLNNTWAFFNLIFLQNVFAFIFAIWSHKKGNLGTNEKTSIEGIIAPGVLTLLSAILCYGLADIIYYNQEAKGSLIVSTSYPIKPPIINCTATNKITARPTYPTHLWS